MKVAPILSYFIYNGFEKDLDAAMIYERLMDSPETSDMHSHAMTFMRSFTIRQWRLNNSKTLFTLITVLCTPPSHTQDGGHTHNSARYSLRIIWNLSTSV